MSTGTARLDLWGKGHRVTRSSEEFQRLVPVLREDSASELERLVDKFEAWPELLDSLHRGTSRALREQYCVRVAATEAAIAIPHATKDAHDRPSILIVVAYVKIDWNKRDELAERVCGARALAMRVGTDFATVLSGANEVATRQLRDGKFILDRSFPLPDESPDDFLLWSDMLGSVARFRGVTGVATPRMAGLGANVVVGTRTEAERAACAGFFETRSRRIIPIGDGLAAWEPEPVKPQPVAIEPAAEPVRELVAQLADIKGQLERIETTVDRVATQTDADASELGRKLETVERRVEQTSRTIGEIQQDSRRTSQQMQRQATLLEEMAAAFWRMFR